MIVNYNNIAHNALYIKSIIKETKLCAVVKANAYGHGIVETARVLKEIVNYFAVFTLEEAQAIDDINVKILILQPLSEQDLLVAISRGYEVSVDSFTSLTRTLKVAKAIGARAKIHIKLDTGMHRFGFFSEQVEDLLEYLCSNYA
ncbi:MAG: alanine racemase, partial [Clostridia bacterium]